MKIYIFRHAQKAMDFTGDPDLTAEGHAQASKLLDKVLKKDLPFPTEIWSSPKKRALSTLRPLAEHFKLNLISQEALLEQTSEENLQEFRQRIRRFLESCRSKKDSVVYVCSHYDWVAEAMTLIPCDTDLNEADFSHWAPCQYAAFELQADGIFKFLDLKRISL